MARVRISVYAGMSVRVCVFVFAFVLHAFTHIYFLSRSNIQNANIACAHATFSLQFSFFPICFSRDSVLRFGLFSFRQCKPHRNQTREMDLILDFCEHFAPPEYRCVQSTLHICMYENEKYMIENRSGITVSLFSKHKIRIRMRMRVCDWICIQTCSLTIKAYRTCLCNRMYAYGLVGNGVPSRSRAISFTQVHPISMRKTHFACVFTQIRCAANCNCVRLSTELHNFILL